MSLRVVDVSFIRAKSISVVFEDAETKERDIAFFQERASQHEIESLKVWRPSPDDVTISFEIELELLEKIQKWAEERGLSDEQIIRALLFYFVKYQTVSL